jgi:hypothetical protein
MYIIVPQLVIEAKSVSPNEMVACLCGANTHVGVMAQGLIPAFESMAIDDTDFS